MQRITYIYNTITITIFKVLFILQLFNLSLNRVHFTVGVPIPILWALLIAIL